MVDLLRVGLECADQVLQGLFRFALCINSMPKP